PQPNRWCSCLCDLRAEGRGKRATSRARRVREPACDLFAGKVAKYNPQIWFTKSEDGSNGEAVSKEDIGERGQWLFCHLITDLCGREDPYFRPRFLGDKFPTFDYIVELVDHPAYYFFVQVRGTTLGYTKDPVRLKVQVSQEDVDRMVACP